MKKHSINVMENLAFVSFGVDMGVGGGWGVGPRFTDLRPRNQKSYGPEPYAPTPHWR